MLYYQSMHDETLKKRQERKHLSNPSPHLFCKFFHRVTLSRSSFIHTSIFSKKLLFDYFQHGIFIYNSLFIPNMSFFSPLSFDIKKKILKENEYDTHFFNFSIFIQSKTPSYFEEETEWKTIFFCIFSSEIPNIFFWQVRKNFSNPNDSHEIY